MCGPRNTGPEKISVIIPAYRETDCLARLLSRLCGEENTEVIVAVPEGDALSAGTAEGFDVKTVMCKKGRGEQLRNGALAARGDVLLFCHADVTLPADWRAAVLNTLAGPGVVGGCFRFFIDSALFRYRVIELGANLRVALTGLAYGDQAFFTTRRTYDEVGGFRPLPIMEDVDFIRRLGRRGKVAVADAGVKVSPRRWEKEGTLYGFVRNFALVTLYLVGVDPEKLARYYR